jgi:hypothetical protein
LYEINELSYLINLFPKLDKRNQSLFILLSILKEKVVTFCIICLNFNWIKYRTAENCNILHNLVRKQRSGCILQLFKVLSGKIPNKMLTNIYLQGLAK